MQGFIRDEDMERAEEEFPGICDLYRACVEKPRTFLDLLARYLARATRGQFAGAQT